MKQHWTVVIAIWHAGCGAAVPGAEQPDVVQDVDAVLSLNDAAETHGDAVLLAGDGNAVDASETDETGDVGTAADVNDAIATADVDATPIPASATITVTADTASLTPPPLSSWFTATVEGQNVTKLCTWTVGPPNVCTFVPPNGAHRTGSGNCNASCTLQAGAVGSLQLSSAPQPVLYLLGGSYTALNGAAELDSGVSRLRVSDKQWDANVTRLPYVIYDGAAGGNVDHIYMVGGQQAIAFYAPPVCGSDIQGCTGPTCKNGCLVPGQDGPQSIGCPKESVAHPEMEGGCGTVWRLDLADASWHAVDSMPLNTTYVGAATNLGGVLYLLTMGNGTGGSMPQYTLDLLTGVKTALGPPLLSAFVVPFGESLAMGDWPNTIHVWKPGAGETKPFTPPVPCPSLVGGLPLASFQTSQPTLVWTTAWRADVSNCPTGSTLDSSKPLAYRTWLSTGGSWIPGPQMPMTVPHGGAILTAGWSGGVFFIPRFEPQTTSTNPSTWLLASPGDHFEEFPPPPVVHSGTVMAVVVIQ